MTDTFSDKKIPQQGAYKFWKIEFHEFPNFPEPLQFFQID